MIKLIRTKAKRAFTLIELVVVIAVIAILAGVSVAAYFGVTNSARESVALQEGEQLKTLAASVATDGENATVKVWDSTSSYTLTYGIKGLTVEKQKQGDTELTELTAPELDAVFTFIYFEGSEGEYTEGDQRFGANESKEIVAVLNYYVESNASGKAVVSGVEYTKDDGKVKAPIKFASDFDSLKFETTAGVDRIYSISA